MRGGYFYEPVNYLFLRHGTTSKVTKAADRRRRGTFYEICSAVPYTSTNLNWMDKCFRSSAEMSDQHSHPSLANHAASVANDDVVFLGAIGWYVGPTILNSFLESYDFSRKTIVLFAASGARIVDGRVLNGRRSEGELKSWISELNL